MKFYDREEETLLLKKVQEKAKKHACFTILKGRRRVGKTSLLEKAYRGGDYLYFFVARKNEADLCLDFQAEVERYFGISLPGQIATVEALFRYLMELSQREHFTLVIDEFQEFLRVNPSIYSTMQRDWDLYKGKSRLNLVVSGSINRLMEQIFAADQPLYGRSTGDFRLNPFSTSTLKAILKDHGVGCNPESLLALWTFTGGVAKYVEQLVDASALTLEEMVSTLISESSPILNEGKVLLVEEFRKDYGTYFSILSLIASGRTSRSEIENVIGSDVGGYLTKLCDDYSVVSKKTPFGSDASRRNMLYQIDDCFLRFWFRFVYRYQSALELKAYDRLRSLILRDYPVFSGMALEQYFRTKLAESGQWTAIGNWYDRKGENEIDIVAVDDLEKRILFAEVKRNPEKINPQVLKTRAQAFLRATPKYADYSPTFVGYSMEDM